MEHTPIDSKEHMAKAMHCAVRVAQQKGRQWKKNMVSRCLDHLRAAIRRNQA